MVSAPSIPDMTIRSGRSVQNVRVDRGRANVRVRPGQTDMVHKTCVGRKHEWCVDFT